MGPTGRARYEFALDGPLARTADALLRTRFDGVSTGDGDPAVLVVDDLDQAGVRALLVLLWDTGHAVCSMTRHPG